MLHDMHTESTEAQLAQAPLDTKSREEGAQ